MTIRIVQSIATTPMTNPNHVPLPAGPNDREAARRGDEPPREATPLGDDAIELAPGVVIPRSRVEFRFSSSSGPGGQNVNKRATKAELRVDPRDIPIREAARARLLSSASARISDDGLLQIVSDEHRSQERNKGECLDRLREMIVAALREPKIRRPTKPSRGSKMRRLDAKKRDGEIKRSRRKPGGE